MPNDEIKKNDKQEFSFIGKVEGKALTEDQRVMLDFFIKNPDIAAITLLTRNDKPMQLAVHQRLILKGLWSHQFNLLILTRGGGKTFLLALYCVLKAMLYPREKCVIASSSYRQSQLVFDEIIRFYDESPLFRQACNKRPSKGPNACECPLENGSTIIAYPMGDGNKIRGARANTLVLDEVAQVPEDIISLVIIPMMNTKQDPFDTTGRKNHFVLASSAYFQFNHLYQKYLQYKENSNPKSPTYDPNYGFHLYTVDDMPQGWMDEAVIKMAKETMTELQFLMEYFCFTKDMLVTTSLGRKEISKLSDGDYVLTHKGDFKEVVGVSSHNYSGQTAIIRAYGMHEKIECTPDHRIYVCRDGEYQWIEAGRLNKSSDMLVVPFDNSIQDIDFIEVANFININTLKMEHGGETYIYPVPSQFKGDRNAIQRSGLPLAKSAIPNRIPVDERLMRLIGYYVAEGTTATKNFRQITFTFNREEQEYANQVKADLESIFGIKVSISEVKSCLVVRANSRIVANFFSQICGSNGYVKHLPEFVKRLPVQKQRDIIMSAWKGDGCLNLTKSRLSSKPYATYCSVSNQLIYDLQLLMFRNGIFGSICKRNKSGHTTNIEGRTVVESDSYNLNLYGNYAREFFKWFDIEQPNSPSVSVQQKCYVSNDHALCSIKSLETSTYNDLVYNCEVKDDNSYCISGFAVHNCLFPPDSDGFFPSSLVNGARKQSVIIEPEGEKGAEYVFGIDPARSGDNFALVVVKLGSPSNKVVACYSLNRKTFPEMHVFIREKIRDYEKNGGTVVRIHMDNGGGGQTLRDLLAEEYAWFNAEDENNPRWETMPAIIDMDNEEYQYAEGRRILRLQVFNPQSINTMNYDLRADMEKNRVLIPVQPTTHKEIVEEIYDEIQAMVEEMMTIVSSPLKSGYLHFDTPKQRMKKDRYSAFLLACQGARELQKELAGPPVKKLATGFASTSFLNGAKNGNLFG